MNKYMIDINLPGEFTQEFAEKIPEQRFYINDLMAEGVILNYSLAIDRRKLWVVVDAKNEEEVMDVLADFPIIDDINFDIHELMFHKTSTLTFPAFSLN